MAKGKDTMFLEGGLMNKQSFFVEILSDCVSNEERAVKLLRLLGFFIHKVDDDYYLSDNASSEEAQELEKMFDSYSLGETKYQNSPQIMKDRMPSIYPADKSIMDISLHVSADSISSMIKECFKPGRRGGEAGAKSMQWSEFLRGRMPAKVNASHLDPFIAYYVKALSACGVETCYSCDGNHKNGGKIICGSVYPFNIFHRYIWNDVCKRFNIEGDIEKGISFEEDNQYDLYYRIYQAAQYLYENRIRYREMKYNAILNLRNYKRQLEKDKRKPTKEQYEDWFCKEFGLSK